MTTFPAAEWTELLTALCAGDPGRAGTPGWLRRMTWQPVTDGLGFAVLELTDPATVPAAAWEPVCGPLRPAPPTRQGHVLTGRFAAPGTGHAATVTLVTDRSPAGTAAAVRSVRIRIEPGRVA
ncbi:hypothetical protein BJ973_003708 [Actinoplanes tereljensis]|uniref:Uncharacterized protein n=1 Tax=Paractinoplanes tereljensis TaxID=571912 RepID=A0A919TWR6_9ACTN|nr:hypothetical protein [Actinoplanes tereljensis]GIF25431.1 hypothetical protein Ate02nite_81610 [Actinoplanes tereljensis]